LEYLSKEDIELLLDTAVSFREILDRKIKKVPALRGKTVVNLFYEPSTRTRVSFEVAAKRLSADVINIAVESSSVKKGETLNDTGKNIEALKADIIVVRHNCSGAANMLSRNVNISVINAGDGANQHPTQTLLDLYTIQKEKGKLDNLSIGFLGDLKYGRTVHSLAMALSHFKTKMFFISPHALKMPSYYLDELKEKGIVYKEAESLSDVSKELDVLYVTRVQQERFPDPVEYEKYKHAYRLNKSLLDISKKDLIIMHPLPRVGEIDPELDETENAVYFRQAGNGIPVRQALLALVLGKVR